MQMPIRTLVLGLLLAFGATAASAQPKAPEATPIDPTATQLSTPQASTQTDPSMMHLAMHPAVEPQSIPIDPAMHPAVASQSVPIDSALQSASAEVQRVARWVSESGDNNSMPFLLVDKVNARVFAFDPGGHLQGTALVLIGMARGDRLLAPNSATMSNMPPKVRITPAGRFVSHLAIDSHGKELLVLDYDASISLHPVIKGTPKEHRAERIVSSSPLDHRISFGCINVPEDFYTTYVHPAFNKTQGVVYVLPEMSPASKLFGFNPVDEGTQQRATASTSNTRASQPVSAAGAQ